MVTRDHLVLRPGDGGTYLVPDRSRAGGYTLRVGHTDQSYVDLNDPLRLEFDYVQRMADVLDTVGEPGARLRVVHIGGAAMTLPRYVAATRPHSAQLVLEPDVELTAFVREHLPLPRQSGIKVRGVDGRAGVAQLPASHADVVVLDAFAGPRVPAELTTVEFFADVRRVLARSGVVVANLTDRAPFSYGRRVMAAVRTQFSQLLLSAEPATLKGRRFGNVLVVASAVPLPHLELADKAGRGPFPYRLVRGERLAQLIGGGAAFTDDDAAPSPEPPRGAAHFS
ncbi:MAG TPA: fused MFS/spermidine synthase [Propionibacteriaceae bacterium]|nr:fused MFS/spermidine synthase [Propionibacteriaceae bacterium]